MRAKIKASKLSMNGKKLLRKSKSEWKKNSKKKLQIPRKRSGERKKRRDRQDLSEQLDTIPKINEANAIAEGGETYVVQHQITGGDINIPKKTNANKGISRRNS